jgi:hypothetical protein
LRWCIQSTGLRGLLLPLRRHAQRDGSDRCTGTVVERYQYDGYGQSTFYDASFTLLSSPESAYGNSYLFTGRCLDNETG